MRVKDLLLAGLVALAAPIDALARDMRYDGATAWLNSPGLTADGLRGKVVLVQFGTYSCINWLRTLPHVRAWGEKYKEQGLVLINVHTPEFEFEKNLENVRRQVKDLRLDFPVAVDNDHAVWRAFANNAWPALYLIDAQGRLRYRHLGEGEYERSERMIQQLLAEAGAAGVPRDLVAVEGRGAEAAADWASLRSPETYLGVERTENGVAQSRSGGAGVAAEHDRAGREPGGERGGVTPQDVGRQPGSDDPPDSGHADHEIGHEDLP